MWSTKSQPAVLGPRQGPSAALLRDILGQMATISAATAPSLRSSPGFIENSVSPRDGVKQLSKMNATLSVLEDFSFFLVSGELSPFHLPL